MRRSIIFKGFFQGPLSFSTRGTIGKLQVFYLIGFLLRLFPGLSFPFLFYFQLGSLGTFSLPFWDPLGPFPFLVGIPDLIHSFGIPEGLVQHHSFLASFRTLSIPCICFGGSFLVGWGCVDSEFHCCHFPVLSIGGDHGGCVGTPSIPTWQYGIFPSVLLQGFLALETEF